MNKALIVVDTQVDFCPGGSLATENGNEVATKIRDRILKDGWLYRLILATKDYHPDRKDFPHFSDNPDYSDTWPPHCVQGTEGAEFHPALRTLIFDQVFYKGQNSAAYSGFEGTSTPKRSDNSLLLNSYLKRYAIKEVDICGIATDFCVKATALDAEDLGFAPTVIKDLCSPVSAEGETQALKEMADAGVNIEK